MKRNYSRPWNSNLTAVTILKCKSRNFFFNVVKCAAPLHPLHPLITNYHNFTRQSKYFLKRQVPLPRN